VAAAGNGCLFKGRQRPDGGRRGTRDGRLESPKQSRNRIPPSGDVFMDDERAAG
jgi:hypothetical protein